MDQSVHLWGNYIKLYCNFLINHMWNCSDTCRQCREETNPMYKPGVLTSAQVMCEIQWSGAVVFMTSEWPEKPAYSLKTNREKTESTLWQQNLMSHREAKGNILLYKTVIFHSLEFIRYAKGVVTHLTIGVPSLLTVEHCWKPLQTHFAMKLQTDAYFRIKASMMWFFQVEHIPELTCFVGTTLL